MAIATYVKFQQFAFDLGKKLHDLNADTFKVVLTNVAPDAAANTVLADITQIAAGNGYVTGGLALTTTWTKSGGVSKFDATDKVITASGGPIGPFRYVVIVNDTSASKLLVGYWDYGSARTLADGEDLTVDVNATNGLFKLS